MLKYNTKLISLFWLVMIGIISAQAQDGKITITGQVNEAATAQPLPGATIAVVGTTIGTVSDFNGKFTIEVPSKESKLQASFLGYQPQTIVVGNQVNIIFSLSSDNVSIDEVAVVGYGVQKRSNITGSVSTVRLENIENKSIARLDQALQGMSSGVMVTQNGGAPGAQPTVHIRGVGSILNTDPIYIIDGVELAPGNYFDINDAETIEILKDAASSAIYGSRAAHGVILVTTKKGKGDLKVTYKSSMGKRSPIKLPELLRGQEYVDFVQQAQINGGKDSIDALKNVTTDTDWLSAYYAGSGKMQSHNLSVSKGDEKFDYYFSLGYDREEGILIENDFNRFNARLNSNARLTNWLKFGENFMVSMVKENPIDNFNENYNGAIPFRSTPIMPIHDPSNQYGGWGTAPAFFQGPNPVATQMQQHETRKYNRFDGNIYLEVKPFTGFTVRSTFSYNYSAYLMEQFHEAFYYGAFANTKSSLTFASADDATLMGNIVGTYEKTLGGHNFKLMAGYERNKFQTLHFNLTGNDFPVNYARSMNLATGSFATTDRQNVGAARRISYFGRLNYNYDEKYLFEANFRRDASAPKFGSTHIWGVFPSYSIGWVVSKEEFFASVPYVNSLKIRASSGKLGSDKIPDFIWDKTYTSQFTSYSFDQNGNNKETGFFISKFPNKDVKWEEVNMNDIGLNLGAFDNKLTFSFDYYVKNTKDLLYPVPIPPSVGISVHNFSPVNPQMNVGTMRNTGVDLELGYKWQIRKFMINANANTSFMRNKMLSLVDQSITGGDGGGQIGGMTRTEAGMPVSSFYGYKVRKIISSDEEMNAINSYPKDGKYQESGTGPGDFMYWDISGPDGNPDWDVTAEHDRTYIGNPWPKTTYALNLSVSWNNMIDIALQFQGVQGVDIFNADKAYTRNFFGDCNSTTKMREAWTPDHHTSNPRNISGDPNGNFGKPSDYFVEDGSYLKLRNIQIGFIVPKHWLTQIKLPYVRLYVNANNIFTITKYSGLDPEIAGSNTSRGVDYGLYPQVRIVSGGLEVNF